MIENKWGKGEVVSSQKGKKKTKRSNKFTYVKKFVLSLGIFCAHRLKQCKCNNNVITVKNRLLIIK